MADILVVASKVKDFIRQSGEMNTSAAFIETLSNTVKEVCAQAIKNAQADGRKTVMDRDLACSTACEGTEDQGCCSNC